MNKVLVTGANGLIGNSILQELALRKIEIIAVIKNKDENVDNITGLSGLRLVYCDLENIASILELIPDRDIDACIHLAWVGSFGDARADSKIQLANIQYTLSVVNTIAKMNIKRFIGAGTLMELDALNYIPVDGSIPNSISHYPIAKIAARFMTKVECTKLGIEHLWCLISNTYGPGIQSGFISYVASHFLKRETAEFTSGEQLYDFMYIQDTAKAFVAVVYNGKSHNTYYLGSNHPRKLKDYIKVIRNAIDPSIMVEFGKLPFHGVSLTPDDLDCSKLIEETGFHPNFSFEQGIQQTIAWMRKDNEKKMEENML